ncbi:MAG: hypothetical protein RL605_829 [Actinomycetota bacterium]|jgi:cytochrome oxidase assembly protein ShyY1
MSYFKLSWRRWLSWLAVVIVFAIACTFLSRWQFARRAEVVAKNDLISGNYDMAIAPIEKLAPRGRFVAANEWRPVSISGHYVAGTQLLVRNKPYAGEPGFLQVGVFQARDLSLYLVDRGWLPTGNEHDSPDIVTVLPSGELDIVGRIRAAEPTGSKTAPKGQLPTVDPIAAAHQLALKEPIAAGVYVRLASETPSAKVAPRLETMPELSEGNHLSYAIQWIMFAILAFATLVWFVRQEFEHYRAATEANFVPRKRRVTRAQRDNEAEDAN